MGKEHVKGAADTAKGAIKDAAGKVTGDEEMQAEGKIDKVKDAARKTHFAGRPDAGRVVERKGARERFVSVEKLTEAPSTEVEQKRRTMTGRMTSFTGPRACENEDV
jgi:uncharacterized protein YjbJ (UPF0337 family)